MKQEHRLWYTQAAGKWAEALPIGNGRLGAMIFGGTAQDRLQLNEDKLYAGTNLNRVNPAASRALPEVRALLADDRIEEAERLAQAALSGTPRYNDVYQPLGELFIRTSDRGRTQGDYMRLLDLADGVAHTAYSLDGVTYTRNYFASATHNVIAIRLRSDKPEALSFTVNLMRRPFDPGSRVSGDGDLVMSGQASPGGISYACVVRVCCATEHRTVYGDAVQVQGAQEAWIYVTAATSYRHDDPVLACTQTLDSLRSISFEQLLRGHIEAYRAQFHRVSFSLHGPDRSHLPTDVRLAE